MQLTEEQQTIVKAASGPNNLFISAMAGCAKTTTLLAAADASQTAGLALAFNRSVANHIKPKLPSYFRTFTLNGLGHLAWLNRVKPLHLDQDKQRRILAGVLPKRVNRDKYYLLCRAISLSQARGLTKNSLKPDFAPTLIELGLELSDACTLQSVLDKIEEEALAGIISFDDQIWAPVALGSYVPRFPLVLVDEAQDLSPIQHQLVASTLNPTSRLFVVGDPRQAIYAWRGAHSNSMPALHKLRLAWQDLPLTTTFRCPKRIVSRLQSITPGFTAFDTNCDGNIEKLPRYKLLERLAPGMAVLCRTNAPLIEMAAHLISEQIPFDLAGRDLAPSLRRIVNKTKSVSPDAIDQAENAELAKYPFAGEETTSLICDRYNCLRALISHFSPKSPDDLLELIDRLFAKPDADAVILTTIHRAKGLEWPVVAILPSNANSGSQEANLRYVAETRTSNTLLLVEE